MRNNPLKNLPAKVKAGLKVAAPVAGGMAIGGIAIELSRRIEAVDRFRSGGNAQRMLSDAFFGLLGVSLAAMAKPLRKYGPAMAGGAFLYAGQDQLQRYIGQGISSVARIGAPGGHLRLAAPGGSPGADRNTARTTRRLASVARMSAPGGTASAPRVSRTSY